MRRRRQTEARQTHLEFSICRLQADHACSSLWFADEIDKEEMEFHAGESSSPELGRGPLRCEIAFHGGVRVSDANPCFPLVCTHFEGGVRVHRCAFAFLS